MLQLRNIFCLYKIIRFFEELKNIGKHQYHRIEHGQHDGGGQRSHSSGYHVENVTRAMSSGHGHAQKAKKTVTRAPHKKEWQKSTKSVHCEWH